jgi:hypothetical protein
LGRDVEAVKVSLCESFDVDRIAAVRELNERRFGGIP